MADSLDDFFAKKDKKRGKNKGTATLSSEVLVRELEEGSKQVEYSSRKESKTSAAIEILGLDANDADWRDFDEVDKRDYTGLKVKEMSLQDQADAEQRRPSADQTDGAPDISAWKTKEEQQQSQVSTASTTNNDSNEIKNPEPKSDTDKSVSGVEPKSDPASTVTGPGNPGDEDEEAKKTGDKPSAKYRVPAMRNADVHELKPTVMGKSRPLTSKNNERVDIQDTQMFPSLG